MVVLCSTQLFDVLGGGLDVIVAEVAFEEDRVANCSVTYNLKISLLVPIAMGSLVLPAM